jgi:hypothetical protein
VSIVSATLGIAGVNTRPLHAATVGIAGNWGSSLRPHIEQFTTRPTLQASTRLGDQAAEACWRHASYLLDYTYVLLVARSPAFPVRSDRVCQSHTVRSSCFYAKGAGAYRGF